MNDQHHVRVMMITGWMDTVKQHWPDSQCPKQRAIWLIKRSLMCAGLNAQTYSAVQTTRLVNESGLCISSKCFKYASAHKHKPQVTHETYGHPKI